MVIKSSSVKSLAVFIDFENLALGFQGRNDRFEIKHVLTRLLEKGKIVAKKAYADWHRFSSYTSSLHEAAIELVEIPRRGQTGKNSADIRLCVDAMDLAYSKEHIDTFVIVSGDSDFSPLVSKLKELGKHVIGLGMTNSTSNLLRDNCDEFIYYEDLTQASISDVAFKSEISDTKRKGFLLLAHAYNALRRDNREIIHSSTLKETMRRMKPSFNENYHGYRTFSLMLEDGQREGLLSLATDAKSGTYVVTNLNMTVTEPISAPSKAPQQPQDSQGLATHKEDHHRDNHHQRSPHRRFNNRRPHQGPQRPYGDQERTPPSPDLQESQGSQGTQGPAPSAQSQETHEPAHSQRSVEEMPQVSVSQVSASQVAPQANAPTNHPLSHAQSMKDAQESAPQEIASSGAEGVSSQVPDAESADSSPAEAANKRRPSQAKSQRQWHSRSQRGQKTTRSPRSRKTAADPSPSQDPSAAPSAPDPAKT